MYLTKVKLQAIGHNVNELFCVVRHTAGREFQSQPELTVWGDDAPDSPAMRSGRPGLPSCQTVVEEARASSRGSASESDGLTPNTSCEHLFVA